MAQPIDNAPDDLYILELELKNRNRAGTTMRDGIVHHTSIGHLPGETTGAWSFVYVFFTNGIPFDSPNRSEPCTGC